MNKKEKKANTKQIKKAKEKTDYRLTEKGIAIMAAIDSGLLPKVDGGWDDMAFLKFWELFCMMRFNYTMRQSVQTGKQKARKCDKKAQS